MLTVVLEETANIQRLEWLDFLKVIKNYGICSDFKLVFDHRWDTLHMSILFMPRNAL